MKTSFHRRQVLQAGLALGASFVLPQPARACEFFTTTLRITHPWARATEGDDTSAIVSIKFDQVLETDRLIGVETPVAQGAEMGGVAGSRQVDFLIPKGEETNLGETGIHLRLTGLNHPLEIARTYPLRLIFEKSGAVEADLSIDHLHDD